MTSPIPVAEGAYQRIRAQIVTLKLAPGSSVNPKHLAGDLELDVEDVQAALTRLAHDGLVVLTSRREHGMYVAPVHRAELEQLSQVRLSLEALAARLAAQSATEEDRATLSALRDQLDTLPAADVNRLLDLDHRFHQAIAEAAHNRHLADAIERFLGLSQRLWHLVLPSAGLLPGAVEEHRTLVDAIQSGDADTAAQLMHRHVQGFYERLRELLTIRVSVSYGTDTRSVLVEPDSSLGAAIISTGLPLEQPCGGRGTCHKCKVIAEGALSPLDDKEAEALSEAERGAHYRLACRAAVSGDVSVTLAPIVVYSNKIFRTSDEYKRDDVPLGLAIDLGSTTVAAFLTTLDAGRVCMGAAALNQQTAFGADVISRMAAAQQGSEAAQRLSLLALSSIVQAIDALKLSRRVKERIQRVTIVGNCAMHHLLLRYPVRTLAELPFQPHSTAAVRNGRGLFGDAFPRRAEVVLPPLIGGFVGSDALACLAYYGFDRAPAPMAAIDLGTNGEVMVTDGLPPAGTGRILVASTAAGPAFEGVNISCGTRAVDGAIVGVKANVDDAAFDLVTIGDHPPVGLTGSGLLDLVLELRTLGLVDATGRIAREHPTYGHRISLDEAGIRRILITEEGVDLRGAESLEDATQRTLYLTQHDIRELQKAKGAIRAATETLLSRLRLQPHDLERMILTGSFGSQLNVEAVVGVGMIPPVDPGIVETSANGAGLGAALFLDAGEFARGEGIAAQAEQIDLDLDPDFIRLYVESMALAGRQAV